MRSCALCSQTKPSNMKHGLYEALPIPAHPLESILMDYISGLPTTLCKHAAICVVVFCFSKMVIFIPCHKTTSTIQTAKLFFHNVWPHFGLPQSIIFDRDFHFLNIFWRTLWFLLGHNLNFSTTFHP